jgi:iron(III) transport system ATP-binding protein
VVLMQNGRILQIGPPETVYRRPASRDVAAFFGTPNLIDAKVTGCRPADGEYVLSVECSSGYGDCRADRAFGVGEPVLVMVRPEDVTLAANGTAASSGQLTWTGKVVDGVFRGPRRSLAVETARLRFNVDCPATRAAAVGEAVTLLVDAGNAWALRP